MSRSRASSGFSFSGWKGARKTPVFRNLSSIGPDLLSGFRLADFDRSDNRSTDKPTAGQARASQQNGRPMSALGHKQTKRPTWTLSALPPKADIERHDRHVRFVP